MALAWLSMALALLEHCSARHARAKVRPESVKLVLKWGYAAHLALLCLVDDAFTRLWVLSSTMLTCGRYNGDM